MNIAMAFSDMYFRPACVTIASLFSHNQDSKELELFIIPQNLSVEQTSFIVNLAKQYHRIVHFCSASSFQACINSLKLQQWHGSSISFAKCFADVLFPNVERLLFIDADLFVNHSLEPLWHFDLDGRTIGAAQDLAPGVAFNSGVLLMDLERWRSLGYHERIQKSLLSAQTRYVEQDIFNSLFAQDVRFFSITYNFSPLWLLFGYQNFKELPLNERFTKKDFHELKGSATIFHFWMSGQTFPWNDFDRAIGKKWSRCYLEVFHEKAVCPHKKGVRRRQIRSAMKACLPAWLRKRIGQKTA